MVGDNKWRLSGTEAQEWYFRLMNDPKQFEKERYIDSINVYNSIIEEFQKLYEKTLAADQLTRAKILNGMKQSKTKLAKTQAEYGMFEKYKTRTAISR
jgi:hypothetical protein